MSVSFYSWVKKTGNSSSRINMEVQDAFRDPSVSLLHHPQPVFSILRVTLWSKMATGAPFPYLHSSPFGRSRIKTKGWKKGPSQLSQLLFIVYISVARNTRPYLATRELGNVTFFSTMCPAQN